MSVENFNPKPEIYTPKIIGAEYEIPTSSPDNKNNLEFIYKQNLPVYVVDCEDKINEINASYKTVEFKDFFKTNLIYSLTENLNLSFLRQDPFLLFDNPDFAKLIDNILITLTNSKKVEILQLFKTDLLLEGDYVPGAELTTTDNNMAYQEIYKAHSDIYDLAWTQIHDEWFKNNFANKT